MRRADWLPFLAISAFAFVLRYVYLLQARAVPLFDALVMDGEAYAAWSDRIVAGDWVGDQVFYQAPLYPYFLAIVKLACGNDLWRIRLVQIALGALSCGVIYLAARTFFSRSVGIVAGLLLALYPPAIFFDGLIQKANLGLVWMSLLLLALARATARAESMARWLAAGVVLGLMMLTREETILLVPVLLAWTFFHLREHPLAHRARAVGAWLAGLAIALVPVAARNAAVGGELVLTTSQAGPNFYIGNGPRANGMYVPLVPGRSNTVYERQTAIELAERARQRKLSPKEVSDYWFDQAFAHIRARPGAWLALLGRKTALLFDAYEVPDAEDQYFYERYAPLLRGLSSIYHYGVLLPLAAAGMVLCWSRRRELAALYWTLATLAAGVVLFYVFARYRYPVVPILVLFAAAALVEGVVAVRARRHALLGAALLALAIVAVPANRWIHAKDFQLGEALNNSGTALTKQGDDARAVELFREALVLKPRSPEIYGNLALSLEKLGRTQESIAAFRTALELRPEDPRGEMRLGRALALAGDTNAGIAHLRRGLERDLGNTEGWSWLADAYLRAGDPRTAIATLRKGLELAPASRLLPRRLAWLLATLDDPALRDGAAAVRVAEELVQKTGEKDAEALDVLAAAYAEAAQFERAIATAEKALALAQDPARAQAIEARLALYRRNQPWREPAPPIAR